MREENFDRERLLKLSAKSCDETLSSVEFVELESVLLGSAEAREAFRDYTSVHVTLAGCYGAGAVAVAPGKVMEITEAEVVSMWPRAVMAIAAMVVVGVGAYFLIPREGGEGSASLAEGNVGISGGKAAAPEASTQDAAKAIGMVATPVIESRNERPKGQGATENGAKRSTGERVPPRPGLIAKVLSVSGGAWAEGSAQPKVNDWLKTSTLKLEKGLVRIGFVDGASVTLRGPAEINLLSGNLARLDSGQLVAMVPKSAVGFTVRTNSINVVDLGTVFGMNARPEGDVEVQVFQGEVDLVSPENAPKALAKPKRVRSGQGFVATMAKASAKGAQGKRKLTLAAKKSDDVSYHRMASYNSGVVKTSGPVRFVAGKPNQAIGQYEHNKNLFVFRERAGLWLEEPVEVDVARPGSYRTLDTEATVTAARIAVRSYLLHFNPVGNQIENEGKPGRPVKAAVTFDEPVVGIILNGERLKATDEGFAMDVTKYRTGGRAMDSPTEEVLKNESKGKNADRVILSGDRKTVRVDWRASTGMDEVRVLVRDEK